MAFIVDGTKVEVKEDHFGMIWENYFFIYPYLSRSLACYCCFLNGNMFLTRIVYLVLIIMKLNS